MDWLRQPTIVRATGRAYRPISTDRRRAPARKRDARILPHRTLLSLHRRQFIPRISRRYPSSTVAAATCGGADFCQYDGERRRHSPAGDGAAAAFLKAAGYGGVGTEKGRRQTFYLLPLRI